MAGEGSQVTAQAEAGAARAQAQSTRGPGSWSGHPRPRELEWAGGPPESSDGAWPGQHLGVRLQAFRLWCTHLPPVSSLLFCLSPSLLLAHMASPSLQAPRCPASAHLTASSPLSMVHLLTPRPQCLGGPRWPRLYCTKPSSPHFQAAGTLVSPGSW